MLPYCNPLALLQTNCHLLPSRIARDRLCDQREAEERGVRRCNSEKPAYQIRQCVIAFFLGGIAGLCYFEFSES